MPSTRTTAGAAALLVGVAALFLNLPADGPPAAPPGVGPGSLALERSAEVIDAKIARKAKRLAEGGTRPDAPDAAARYRMLQRTSHGGDIPLNALMDAKRKVESMMPLSRDGGIWNWTWLGPGNIGGRIRSILIHPTTPSTMWVGSVSGGIWKSLDSGSSWAPQDDFLPSLSVTQLVMDPSNSQVIYAGTGEGFSRWKIIPGAGIFKTTDGGTNWDQLSATVDTLGRHINDIAIHPTNGDILYACARPEGNSGTVWKTTNGGLTWDKTLLSTPTRVTDVKIDPDIPEVVFVGSSARGWRSTNGGVTWDELTDGGASSLPDSTGRIDFWAAGAGSDVVYE